jgi:acyl dehydratase
VNTTAPPTNDPDINYFESFSTGMTFCSPSIDLDADAIVRFAREFDPQPFHLDPQAGADSFFGALVASGWHTAALTMRLLVESGLGIAGGLVGAGGEIKWPAVLRPGDRIHVETEVIATRPLRSRADMGMITVRSHTINGAGAIVQELTANLFVPRRPPVAPPSPAPDPTDPRSQSTSL